MTKNEALKMAKEFIKEVMNDEAEMFGTGDQEFVKKPYLEMIGAIDEALEQPAQEPVAWSAIRDGKVINVYPYKPNDNDGYWKAKGFTFTPLYTHPHQWQGLSNDMVRAIGEKCQEKNRGILNWIDFYNAINEMLKEKNHG